MLGIDREKPIRGIVRNLSQDGKGLTWGASSIPPIPAHWKESRYT